MKHVNVVGEYIQENMNTYKNEFQEKLCHLSTLGKSKHSLQPTTKVVHNNPLKNIFLQGFHLHHGATFRGNLLLDADWSSPEKAQTMRTAIHIDDSMDTASVDFDDEEDEEEEEDDASETYEVASHEYSIKRLLKLCQKIDDYRKEGAYTPQGTLRRFSAELSDAVCEVKSFFVYDGLSSFADEVADAIRDAESWFESRNEHADDYRDHFLRLCILRNNKHYVDTKMDDGPGDAHQISSSITIPIGGEHFETQMLEMTRAQIQQFRMFSSTNNATNCLSWLGKDNDLDDEENENIDPNVTKTYDIISYDDPSIVLGRIGLSIRFLPQSPALYIFNEYDFDHDGNLSRSEFAAFTSDLAIAGGNLDRLEDNLKYPGRNTCLGTFLCLTAPETDLISFVGMRHSLTMWAYKPDPSANMDARIEERAMLAVMLVFWSIAVNCAGPGLLEASTQNFNKISEYGIVILTDSIGQIFIFIFFMLQHNTVIRKCMFASPESKVPERIECDWHTPLSTIQSCFSFTFKNCLQGVYRIIFIWIPLVVTVLFSLLTVSVFIYYQLWQYAATFLLTIPSARLLELFKHATVWGIKTQFGAARETLDGKRRKNKNNSLDSNFLFPMLVKMMEGEEKEASLRQQQQQLKLQAEQQKLSAEQMQDKESVGEQSPDSALELVSTDSVIVPKELKTVGSSSSEESESEEAESEEIDVDAPPQVVLEVDIERTSSLEVINTSQVVIANEEVHDSKKGVKLDKLDNDKDLNETLGIASGGGGTSISAVCNTNANFTDSDSSSSDDNDRATSLLVDRHETLPVSAIAPVVHTTVKQQKKANTPDLVMKTPVIHPKISSAASSSSSIVAVAGTTAAAEEEEDNDHSIGHVLQLAYHKLMDAHPDDPNREKDFLTDPFNSLHIAIASASQESSKELEDTIYEVERIIKKGGKYGKQDNLKIFSKRNVSKLKKLLLQTKSVLAKKKLADKYGAIATIWPRPNKKKQMKHKKGGRKDEDFPTMKDSGGDDGDGVVDRMNRLLKQTSSIYQPIIGGEGSSSTGDMVLIDVNEENEENEDDEDDDYSWWQFWKYFNRQDLSETDGGSNEAKSASSFQNDNLSSLNKSNNNKVMSRSSSTSSISSNQSNQPTVNIELRGLLAGGGGGGEYGSMTMNDEWGMVLMHRDGKWPLGIKNEISSKQCRTDEIEVELSVVEDRRGYSHQTSSLSAAALQSHSSSSSSLMKENQDCLVLKEEEWSDLVRYLTSGLVYAFPLNPLKDLVRRRGAFDKQRKTASTAKQKFKRLSQQDRNNLATSKNDLDSKIDYIIQQGGDTGHACLPDCMV